MRNFYFLIAMLLACQLSACKQKPKQASIFEECFTYWVSGINAFESQNYDESVAAYSEAISLLETEDQMDENHLYLYNARGQAYLLSERYQESISDFNKVLETQNAPLSQTIKALWGRMINYAALGDTENFNQDYEKLKKTDPAYPSVEYTKNYVIFRNFEASSLTPGERKAFCCAMIHFDLCESKEDILFTKTGVCLVKRKCSCGCKKSVQKQSDALKNGQYCNSCDQIVRLIPAVNGKTEDSQYGCDRTSQAAFVKCANAFKTFPCRLMCVSLIEALREGGHWHYQGDEFYKKSVESFENLICQVP